MSELHPQGSDDEGDVELISDGENLLVFGENRRSVEGFLRAHGLLERAFDFGSRRLVPALYASAQVAQRISDAAAESGLWVKLTSESAEFKYKFGLTDSDVPGVAHAMVGARGSIKKWLQIDTTAGAKATNPAALSGVAGALAQAAREQEAAQLRQLLENLDQKLDQVLRGQRDDILGDIAGIEREIRAAMLIRKMDGSVDGVMWSKLAGASMQTRQVQSKAILKLGGIADDLERHRKLGDLNADLQHTKDEVRMWLSGLLHG
ncbi:hypothetical protein IWX78_003250 [Mycetocola sp. CAN_C7]|uniref:hypothetical protein n=1 Tax=Mycetocola sp. CAN_C7 TaxID=2787724 RepID=UPI0018CA96F7